MYDPTEGAIHAMAAGQSGQQFLTLITKGQPAPWRRNRSGNLADVWHGRCSLSQTIRSHLQATNHAMAVRVSQHVRLPVVEFVTRAVFSTQIAAQHPPLEGRVRGPATTPVGMGRFSQRANRMRRR